MWYIVWNGPNWFVPYPYVPFLGNFVHVLPPLSVFPVESTTPLSVFTLESTASLTSMTSSYHCLFYHDVYFILYTREKMERCILYVFLKKVEIIFPPSNLTRNLLGFPDVDEFFLMILNKNYMFFRFLLILHFPCTRYPLGSFVNRAAVSVV